MRRFALPLSAASSGDPNLRWNFSLGVLNGVMFRQVDSLVHPSLVLVVLLSQLTDNPIILGMPMALWSGGDMLSQLLASGYIQRRARILPVYRGASVARIGLWIGLVAGTLFIRDPAWLVVNLLFFLVAYPLLSGVTSLIFYEIVGKTIPPHLRGLLFSWRQALGGVVALGAGWLVNRALAEDPPLPFPTNFAAIFAVAMICVIIGVLLFSALREPVAEPHPPIGRGLRGIFQEAARTWKADRLFRHYVLAYAALMVAGATAPLIIVYARNRFGLPLNAAAIYLIADTVMGLIAVAVSGWLSMRVGSRRLALISIWLGLATFGLIVLSGWLQMDMEVAFLYFLMVFILLAAHNSTRMIGFMALNLNIPPPERRPLYLGLSNTIIGGVAYLSIVQGLVVGVIGYLGLFVLAVGLAGFSLWQTATYVYDPTETDIESWRYGER